MRQIEDLDQLKYERRQRRALDVALPAFSEDENAGHQRRLLAYYQACGCTEGSVFTMIGFVLTTALVVVRSGFSWPSWLDLSLGSAVVVMASVAGKMFGQWRAARHLEAEIGRIKTAAVARETTARVANSTYGNGPIPETLEPAASGLGAESKPPGRAV